MNLSPVPHLWLHLIILLWRAYQLVTWICVCGIILIVLHLKQHLLLDKICNKNNIDWAQTQHEKCCEKCPVGSSSSSVIFAVSQSVNVFSSSGYVQMCGAAGRPECGRKNLWMQGLRLSQGRSTQGSYLMIQITLSEAWGEALQAHGLKGMYLMTILINSINYLNRVLEDMQSGLNTEAMSHRVELVNGAWKDN